jgi:sulfate adenylyltransferase large subunit
MSAALALPPDDPAAENLVQSKGSLLHLLTCGSVDDGKSTLLGRLLFDSHAVLDDQLTALDRDSLRFGTQGQGRDFALLVDGLAAEREQGITIDVAYRYFSTERRAFIVADTPGHEQYTRNMATGASTAELAIILVDARKGVLPQTRRHSYIVSMLGVRKIVLAVNKMDLVGFAPEVYRQIVDDYSAAVATLGFGSIVAIPICAREGDNIVAPSLRTPWYDGPTLLDYLENVVVAPATDGGQQFRFPVQWVNRPTADFRGYAGSISSGTVRPQQSVMVLPGGHRSRIASIVTADGLLDTASAGQAITLTLTDEIDVSRGDVLVPAGDTLSGVTDINARVLWMGDEALDLSQVFLIKLGTATANARIKRLHHAVDIHSFEPRPAATLAMNEIAWVHLTFDKPIVADDYNNDRALGAFVLIDRMTNQTAALGVVGPIAKAVSTQEAPIRRLKVVLPSLGAWRDRDTLQPLFWTLTSKAVNALVLWTIVFALTDNKVLAVAVAIINLAVSPIVGRLLRSAWPRGWAAGRPT